MTAYFLERAGFPVPDASTQELLANGRRNLLPYRGPSELRRKEYIDQCYYATHVVFVKTKVAGMGVGVNVDRPTRAFLNPKPETRNPKP